MNDSNSGGSNNNYNYNNNSNNQQRDLWRAGWSTIGWPCEYLGSQ